jgi:hypothetical protein
MARQYQAVRTLRPFARRVKHVKRPIFLQINALRNATFSRQNENLAPWGPGPRLGLASLPEPGHGHVPFIFLKKTLVKNFTMRQLLARFSRENGFLPVKAMFPRGFMYPCV